jgi:uncharacterized protein (DUF433 family)
VFHALASSSSSGSGFERAERLKSLRPGAFPLLLDPTQRACLVYPEGVVYEQITINSNRMSGLPCIRDTQVTVSAVLGQIAAGRSIEEILADYLYLEWVAILAALGFAAAAIQDANCRSPNQRRVRARL